MNGIGVAHRTFFRTLLVSLSGASLGLLLAAGQPAYGKDQQILAKYSINFNGLSIGDFRLNSSFSGDSYDLKARAQISLLGGLLFEWRGDTTSSGRLHSRGPRPSSFNFGFRSSGKSGDVALAFTGNRVSEMAVNPPQKSSDRRIPVTRAHMQNVVDPLSAVVMLSKRGLGKSGGEVCKGRIPIFDGNARYDLRLSYKTTRTVSGGYGYSGPAFVCKVKFVPIAGHKRGDDESEFAARNEGIEVWMVPLKAGGLYVPHYINIPTPVGTASLTASKFEVESGARRDAMLQ